MLDPCPLFIDFFFVLFDFVFVIWRFTRFSKQQQRQRQQQWQDQPQQLQYRSCTSHPMQPNSIHNTTPHHTPVQTVPCTQQLWHYYTYCCYLYYINDDEDWDIALNHFAGHWNAREYHSYTTCPLTMLSHTLLHGPPKSVFHVYLIAFRSRHTSILYIT